MQFVLHAREGAPGVKGFPYAVGASFFDTSPCKTKVGLALGGRAMFRRSRITAGHTQNSSMASNSSS